MHKFQQPQAQAPACMFAGSHRQAPLQATSRAWIRTPVSSSWSTTRQPANARLPSSRVSTVGKNAGARATADQGDGACEKDSSTPPPMMSMISTLSSYMRTCVVYAEVCARVYMRMRARILRAGMCICDEQDSTASMCEGTDSCASNPPRRRRPSQVAAGRRDGHWPGSGIATPALPP